MASAFPADSDAHTSSPHRNDASTFAASLVDQVNRDDIPSMVYIQRDMLGRFEKTNEMLINFNMLSSGRYEATLKEFQKHTQLLFDMKKDLNGIFRRIRVIKNRLEKTYPDAFSACSHIYNVVSDDEEEEEGDCGEDQHAHKLQSDSKRNSSGFRDAVEESVQSSASENQHGSNEMAKTFTETSVSKPNGAKANTAPHISQNTYEKSLSPPPKS